MVYVPSGLDQHSCQENLWDRFLRTTISTHTKPCLTAVYFRAQTLWNPLAKCGLRETGLSLPFPPLNTGLIMEPQSRITVRLSWSTCEGTQLSRGSKEKRKKCILHMPQCTHTCHMLHMCIHMHAYTQVYTHATCYVCVYICMSIHTRATCYTCVCICMHIHKYTYTCHMLHMCTHTCMHVHT